MSPITPLWLHFCSRDGPWFSLDWYCWAHRQVFFLTKCQESGTPSCHNASGRSLLLTFPLLILGGSGFERPTRAGLQVSKFQELLSPCLTAGKDGLRIAVLPAELCADTSTQQPYSFTSWTVLSPGGKTFAGYTSRGFIPRAKVKAIKYSIVIILGKWKVPQLVAREDADVRKLVLLSSLLISR